MRFYTLVFSALVGLSIAASSTTTSSLSPSPTRPPGIISSDGTCGGAKGVTCLHSQFGDCCSSSGFCGNSTAHCNAGCDPTFGKCTTTNISPDGTCGGTKKYKCEDSSFGNCCSSSGFCGSSPAHCTAGCQLAFGVCTNPELSPDGTCGGTNKFECAGSGYGDCCSEYNYCGATPAHCEVGCQHDYGNCSTVTTSSTVPKPSDVSTDGSCGKNGKKCQGSGLGNCCSSTGYCGDTVGHCAQGCQKSFSSNCTITNIPTLDGTCGVKRGNYTCTGGPFDGRCCSADGFCGTTTEYCGVGCQKSSGICK